MQLMMSRPSHLLDIILFLSVIYDTTASVLTAPQLFEYKAWVSVEILASILWRGWQGESLAPKHTVLLSFSPAISTWRAAVLRIIVGTCDVASRVWQKRQLEEEKQKWTKARWELSLKNTQAVVGTVMEFLSDAGGHISERSGLFAWDNK